PSAKYVGELTRDLSRFAGAIPELSRASEEEVRGYLRSLRDRRGGEVSLRRRDNVRDAIVRLCRFARSRGYLPEDKISTAEKIETLSHGGDVTTYTPAQLAVWLGHVSHQWRPWMAIAAFAGLRTSEIFRLDWSDVKFTHSAISV